MVQRADIVHCAEIWFKPTADVYVPRTESDYEKLYPSGHNTGIGAHPYDVELFLLFFILGLSILAQS